MKSSISSIKSELSWKAVWQEAGHDLATFFVSLMVRWAWLSSQGQGWVFEYQVFQVRENLLLASKFPLGRAREWVRTKTFRDKMGNLGLVGCPKGRGQTVLANPNTSQRKRVKSLNRGVKRNVTWLWTESFYTWICGHMGMWSCGYVVQFKLVASGSRSR